jgi:hypothetical protein
VGKVALVLANKIRVEKRKPKIFLLSKFKNVSTGSAQGNGRSALKLFGQGFHFSTLSQAVLM